ncbi:thiolase family protein [Caulobacter sp. ErkDOM-E]|uniref:thiolase family protein n=1 Tax=Caulobacter sp. ErkDOM-E TaxID=3402778 RepID=UPI003AF5C74F
MTDTYLVAGVRTPFVKAGTAYAGETPLTLSATVLQAIAGQHRPDLIVWGQVIPSLSLSNIAREAALDAGLDPTIPAYSTQLACSTSMMGAIQASGLVGRGGIELALVGGVEQMSRSPIALEERVSARLAALAASDPAGAMQAFAELRPTDFALPKKGWANRISGRSMGDHMEETAKLLSITRQDQDKVALASHHNAEKARRAGFFDDLLVPFAGVTEDGLIRADTTAEKLASLRPVFDPLGGSLSAGNSSPLTDGAAGMWVASAKGLAALGKDAMAVRLVDFELGALDFRTDGMLMAPAYAIPRLLARNGLRFEDIAIWEVHEAFAAQLLANIQVAADPGARAKHAPDIGDLGPFPWDRLNPVGGSLALGHPFAATGARIISQTAKQLAGRPAGTKAVISICADGGQGTVILVEAI